MKIISASRREDMPAFHFPELKAAYDQYEAKEPNFWVFWTKDCDNLINSGFDFNRAYLQLTITGLGGTPLEPGVPKADTVIESLTQLIGKGFSPNHISWRLDPIIPTYHNYSMIDDLAYKIGRLGITRCTSSFITWYGHVKERWPEGASTQWSIPKQRTMIAVIKDILSKRNIELYGCAQPALNCIVKPAKCMDGDLYKNLTGISFDSTKDPSQRNSCGCTLSTDIGRYRQCPHRCLYCYGKKSVSKQQTFSLASADSER